MEITENPANHTMDKFILKTLLALLGVAMLTGVVSCRNNGAASKPDDVDYYTCTMHPSVRKQNPNDKCPICSMDLVPVMKRKAAASPGEKADAKGSGMSAEEHSKMAEGKAKDGMNGMKRMPGMQETKGTDAKGKSGAKEMKETARMPGMKGMNMKGADEATNDEPGEFMVPVARQQQIGVTYATIEKKPLKYTIRAVGTVAYDKQRHWDYVARVEGYVKKLSVFSRGELVEKDAALLTIYSPDLLTTQNEFVDLLKMRDEAQTNGNPAVLESAGRLVESAKQRLRLWNITDEQIAELEKTRKPQEALTLYSPFKGVVQDLPVDQGRRVMTGDHLVDIADLSVVWVWAQFYQDELPLLKKGLPVTITTSSYPGEKFDGKISVVDPFMNEALRTGRARIDVENPGFKLRPDMFVDIELAMDMGEGLTVPVSAVLPTGQRNIAFVDKGEGKLEPRFVGLGRNYGDFYAVTSGLKEGERVVNSANFLIDAESKVQGALKNF
jgi:Cu(I)/Ag(I) efflux system membrane fusion protein